MHACAHACMHSLCAENYSSLVSGMEGCRACVECSHAKRTTQLKDVFYKIWDPDLVLLGAWGPSKSADEDYDMEDMRWLDPASSPDHPFNWAVLAACNLRDAAIETGCPHLVRLSEAQVSPSEGPAQAPMGLHPAAAALRSFVICGLTRDSAGLEDGLLFRTRGCKKHAPTNMVVTETSPFRPCLGAACTHTHKRTPGGGLGMGCKDGDSEWVSKHAAQVAV
jgi:hypothetical protein